MESCCTKNYAQSTFHLFLECNFALSFGLGLPPFSTPLFNSHLLKISSIFVLEVGHLNARWLLNLVSLI